MNILLKSSKQLFKLPKQRIIEKILALNFQQCLSYKQIYQFNTYESTKTRKKTKNANYNDKFIDRNNTYFREFRKMYQINDILIFSTFKTPGFLFYMGSQYRMLPFLFDDNFIIQFRKEFETNIGYQEEIGKWFETSLEERQEQLKEIGTSDFITKRKLLILYPFIELYMQFLNLNYKHDLQVSESLSEKTDLRMPHNWFPQARKLKRKIIYHHGPTNSGKTYSALKDLESASNGIYCAPLRLLAWEIHEKLQNSGIRCSLLTGQEKNIQENSRILSCTVEMADLSNKYEVAIIDEIQMIGDQDRGSAWTNALLGLQADRIHLCGDQRGLRLVAQICQLTGDTIEERTYQRFSKLYIDRRPLNLETDLKEGDCVITFSTKNRVNKIYSDRSNACAVVYGKLPPENRKDQARRYNDPASDLKYLIATNAIGMGLNLNIKRIIFSTLMKGDRNGNQEQIDFHEIKQIAGRAGRFTDKGIVCCLKRQDLKIIKQALKGVNLNVMDNSELAKRLNTPIETYSETNSSLQIDEDIIEISQSEDESDELKQYQQEQGKQELDGEEDDWSEQEESLTNNIFYREFRMEETLIKKAGIFPNYQQIETFARDLERYEQRKLSLENIFTKFVSIAKTEGIYFIQRYDDFCKMAELIQKFDLDLKDQFTFCCAPLSLNPKWTRAKQFFKQFAQDYINYNSVMAPQQICDNNKYFTKTNFTTEDLYVLEEDHHILDLYIWLGYKYETAFYEVKKANQSKEKICALIDKILEN